MKCPIKKLESDCIEKECPLYFTNSCGLSAFLIDVGAIEPALEGIENKIDCLSQTIEAGLRRV